MKARLVLVGAVLLLGFTSASLLPHLLVEASPTSTLGYQLSWWTVDGGGGTSAGGGYHMDGTISQPDPGFLTGGSYTLGGGFWHGLQPAEVEVPGKEVFLPFVLR
jgi:hypothetical protein